jgi:hypothetical protein
MHVQIHKMAIAAVFHSLAIIPVPDLLQKYDIPISIPQYLTDPRYSELILFGESKSSVAIPRRYSEVPHVISKHFNRFGIRICRKDKKRCE